MTDTTDAHLHLREHDEATLGPVEDWATDFDMFEPGYVADPASRWAEQREQ